MAKFEKKDPHHQREAQSYEFPVPSREFILAYLREHKKPISLKQFFKLFNLKLPEEQTGLERRLEAMLRDGQLQSKRRGQYALLDQNKLISGRVLGHRDGFGFLIPDDEKGDIFLSARQMRGVFTDDRVLVRVTGKDRRNRREGAIVEVLKRNTQHIVGRYYQEANIAFVTPDSKTIPQNILIPNLIKKELRKKQTKSTELIEPKHGEFVVVEIITQPTSRRQATGKIIQILGNHLTPGMEVELAIRSHDLPFEWTKELINEAKKFGKTVKKSDLSGRTDLRMLKFVTIDGEDAKDFDDAVYCEPNPKGGWQLWVAIADVSHYVKLKSALDTEAEQRGNSVYFPSRVIPMLPEALSNELCSLKPNVDRLALVCAISLTEEGEVIKYHFEKAIIHSHARLTYQQVADWLKERKKKNSDLMPSIIHLYQLYKKLLKQRKGRGALDFETTETRVLFDNEGKIDRIIPTERNDAHKIIEECMLLANVCTADYLEKAKMPTLYRIHEGPQEDKLLALRDFLKAFGLRLSGGNDPSASDYASLLARVEKRPNAHLIQTVMLRSLRQAIYSPDNVGHFGLSYEGYCHFTSPIRRYPDLLIHRAIKHVLKKRKPQSFFYQEKDMEALGSHCSVTERRADRATRDALDWLKCDYMINKVGQEFAGAIVEVTAFGIFVELKDVYVQGLVHISQLTEDFYQYDPAHFSLTGQRSGKKYCLADTVKIIVTRVDMDQRSIDFVLADGDPEKKKIKKSDKNKKSLRAQKKMRKKQRKNIK